MYPRISRSLVACERTGPTPLQWVTGIVVMATVFPTQLRGAQGNGTPSDMLSGGPAAITPDLPYDSPVRNDLDAYGGWTKLKGTKTGFFHTEKIDKRWWFITPEGNVYFLLGVTMHAGHPATKQKDWHAAQARRLRAWGFNCTQTGARRPDTADRGIPFVFILNMARSARPSLPISYTPGLPPWTTFPDVFDPAWPERCRAAAKRHLKPLAKDPMLLGYFLDNELSLSGWYQAVTNAVEDAPARKAFVEVARKFYADKAGQLVDDWKKYGVKTVDDLLKVKGAAPRVPKLEAAWNRAVAERYFSVAAGACKQAAPNHLNLGVRMINRIPPPEALIAMGKHCDVISMNLYSPYADRLLTQMFTLLPTLQAMVKRPFMTSEFSYRGGDTAHPNTTGAPPTVPTQTDRAVGYLSYVSTMASMPFYIGTVWFCYGDQRPEIRWKGYAEDCNFGMVDRQDRPHAVLTEAMRQTNASIYELAADPVKNKTCPLFWRTEMTRWDLDWEQRVLRSYGGIAPPADPMAAMLPAKRRFHHSYWIRHRSPNLIVNDDRIVGACQANMIRKTDNGTELVLIGLRGLFALPRRLWLGEKCNDPDGMLTLESNAQVLVRQLDNAGRLGRMTIVDGSFVRAGLDRMDIRTPLKTPYLDLRYDPEAKRIAVMTRGRVERLALRDASGWGVEWHGKPARILSPKQRPVAEGMTAYEPQE